MSPTSASSLAVVGPPSPSSRSRDGSQHAVAEQQRTSSSSSTTTISTIAVESGQTKIVIAIMKTAMELSIKVLELEPGIAHLGDSFAEAASLQAAHDEVIRNLQSKQSPVEDLLRQADDLIANQKPRAEVYTAMAESLGLAWRDLNANLDLRKAVLDQNYSFQGHFEV